MYTINRGCPSAALTAWGVAAKGAPPMRRQCIPIVLSEKDIARFWENVDRSGGPDACWPWMRGLGSDGYGRFHISRESRKVSYLAHRVAYHLIVGPIPDDLEPDHLCRNHPCCNPLHLDPVTHAENIARGNAVAAIAVRENRCKRGHEFTPENMYIVASSGYRRCRVCQRERNIRRKKQERAERRERLQQEGKPLPGRKLTIDQVRIICQSAPLTTAECEEMAARFGVHRSTVDGIARGYSWSHVKAGGEE